MEKFEKYEEKHPIGCSRPGTVKHGTFPKAYSELCDQVPTDDSEEPIYAFIPARIAPATPDKNTDKVTERFSDRITPNRVAPRKPQ